LQGDGEGERRQECNHFTHPQRLPGIATQDQKYNPEQMQYHTGISGNEEQPFSCRPRASKESKPAQNSHINVYGQARAATGAALPPGQVPLERRQTEQHVALLAA